jgi:hypothetical protein
MNSSRYPQHHELWVLVPPKPDWVVGQMLLGLINAVAELSGPLIDIIKSATLLDYQRGYSWRQKLFSLINTVAISSSPLINKHREGQLGNPGGHPSGRTHAACMKTSCRNKVTISISSCS